MKVPPLKLNKVDYLIKHEEKGKELGRKFVSALNTPGALLPVVLLEGAVTGGRTYQAYQRDGFVEARERVTEESLGAVFWLFGAKIFGNLFDKVGQKFFKIPKNMPDVGKDLARDSFGNFIDKLKKIPGVSPEKAEKIKDGLARYSVGKTFASLLTACLFIGYVVPKINQGITKHLFGKMQKTDEGKVPIEGSSKTKMTLKDARSLFWAKEVVSINAVENFKAAQGNNPVKLSTQKNVQNLSFKARADSLLRIVQNFEENDVWKLMGTDVGTVTGRTANARNKDERVEILFRDISSIYFYCFSMPAIVKFLNNKDKFKGINTGLNPMSAADIHNKLIDAMDKKGLQELTPNAFKEFALGSDKYDETLFKNVFPNVEQKQGKNLFGLKLFKPKKEHRVIELSEFEKFVDAYHSNSEKALSIKNLAKEMSELQPDRLGKKILTESQVEDVLSGGYLKQPKVMKELLNLAFEGNRKKMTNPLTDSGKYISLEKIENQRTNMINYVKSIVQDAETRKVNVTWDSMKKVNKRNMNKNGLFMTVAMGVSAVFLSTIIPKIQYYITYLRTGKNSFPGTENM